MWTNDPTWNKLFQMVLQAWIMFGIYNILTSLLHNAYGTQKQLPTVIVSCLVECRSEELWWMQNKSIFYFSNKSLFSSKICCGLREESRVGFGVNVSSAFFAFSGRKAQKFSGESLLLWYVWSSSPLMPKKSVPLSVVLCYLVSYGFGPFIKLASFPLNRNEGKA